LAGGAGKLLSSAGKTLLASLRPASRISKRQTESCTLYASYTFCCGCRASRGRRRAANGERATARATSPLYAAAASRTTKQARAKQLLFCTATSLASCKLYAIAIFGISCETMKL
jgi:hypothetical protein